METRALSLLGLMMILVSGCQPAQSQLAAARSSQATASVPASIEASKWDYRIIARRAPKPQRFPGTRVFEVGHRRFTTSSEFLSWVASLPQGTTLHWDSGCFMFSHLPLEGSTMTMDEFKRFCVDHQVEFTWRYGY